MQEQIDEKVEKISRKKRSSLRIRKYYQKLFKYKKCVIANIEERDFDDRPYIKIRIEDEDFISLLDSGANRSVIGGELAISIQRKSEFVKCIGNVRTADGSRQTVVGSIQIEVKFREKNRMCEFLVVPSIRQNIICGYDFWKLFGLEITLPSVSTIESDTSTSSHIELTKEQQRRLEAVISIFPNSEVEGLGCTHLIVHEIDTGSAKPIKQRYYPISPAIERQLFGELDRMLTLGVIEEAPCSPWSSPTVVVIKPGKVRMCLDSRKLNSVTEKDAYPIPNIEGILSRLPPVHWISKIDLKDAFWQIRLRCHLGFVMPHKLFAG
ncbi:uncharacterized protein LOC142235742 [Haematobia irritans]|uniref:uncharacterized protein LOC142235742 n=1 Tax=Haematobia irritans TaxID=7368 RepID=UPI003F506111